MMRVQVKLETTDIWCCSIRRVLLFPAALGYMRTTVKAGCQDDSGWGSWQTSDGAGTETLRVLMITNLLDDLP